MNKQFIDDVLSVPFDTRRDLFAIAEKHYEDKGMVTRDEIYSYIFWRVYEIPEDDFLSWAGLFKEYNLYREQFKPISPKI